MKTCHDKREELIQRFVKFAESRDDIRAAIVIGSSARTDHPADEYSDVDIVILARDPSQYLQTTEWLQNFGKPVLTFLEKTAVGGGKERRVLYENGQDVDFAVFPPDEALAMRLNPEDVAVLGRGVRVLIDRDGFLEKVTESSKAKLSTQKKLPSLEEFNQDLNDFLYHVVWTRKKLDRGELWTAKACCDGYMKWLLLRAIEAQAVLTRGPDVDTWHNGRFLEQWADPIVLQGLRTIYARYDPEDVRRALQQTMELYHSLTVEIASKLGYAYPLEQYEATKKLLKS